MAPLLSATMDEKEHPMFDIEMDFIGQIFRGPATCLGIKKM